MNEEFLLPESGDRLFKSFNEDFRHNAIVSAGMSKFFLFSEGYKTAALKIFEQLDGSAFHANFLVYPLIFLNRQFLELRLKELISGLNFSFSQSYDFPNGHELDRLWNTYKNLILQASGSHCPDEATLENVERLIFEFQSIDPQSFSFRYPVDKTAARKPSLKITNIDLLNFMTTMNKLYNFFAWQSDMVFHMIDITNEFIGIMQSEYESEMQSYYNPY